MTSKQYKPENRHTVTPFMVVKDTAKAIDFYKKAFSAKEIVRMPGPDGKTIMHAQIMIGDSIICLSDEAPQCGGKAPDTLGGTPISLFIYVPDVDASYKQAVDAGCSTKMPPADMFWGDRFSSVEDPFGHVWSLATQIEQLSFDEMKKRQDKFFAQMAKV